MRYMMLVRSVAPAGPPPSAFLEAMGKLSAEGPLQFCTACITCYCCQPPPNAWYS
jgi:hypothetical protein